MKRTNRQKTIKKHTDKLPRWDLGLLYRSPTDPQIEKDVRKAEMMRESFAKKYDTPQKEFLKDPAVLLEALREVEAMRAFSDKPLLYFNYLRDIEAENKAALSNMPLLENRLTKASNKVTFFFILLGEIPAAKQKEFLNDERLSRYKVYLERRFEDARHNLSVAEERIMDLKSLPACGMWIAGNEKLLNMQTVLWKGKKMPIAEALSSVKNLSSAKERSLLSANIAKALKKVAPFSEAEINAVVTNRKINDELRGYKTPYENTVRGYRNDPEVVSRLVKTVTDGFPIPHRFYRLKARLLKQKKLSYADRAAKIGDVRSKYPFGESLEILKKTFGALNARYEIILDEFASNGQIDARPRIGKSGGAYCSASYSLPTFVLLNHIDDLYSLKTFAHEMGHAFHFELSRPQGPIYFSCSTSLAETASTLFETLAGDTIYASLPDKEKAVFLHDRIENSISTIFRQIACFNYEKEIHETIRSKGYMSKEELADAHNRHMLSYLGPVFKLDRDDGYMFVSWSHIRRFFYVYTYAFGLLVSKAMLRRYRRDPSFWPKIEQFLSSGGKDSPESILKEIGIDVTRPDFWMEGLKEIEDDIKKLEQLTR
jgi:oligoendopeptidase F